MITYRISFQQLHCLNHYENMTFYMSTSSKKSEQWREILGENIKLENEGDKMRAHAGEGSLLCPSPTSAIASLPISTNRQRIGGKPETFERGFGISHLHLHSIHVGLGGLAMW